jgi:hypothetical protein
VPDNGPEEAVAIAVDLVNRVGRVVGDEPLARVHDVWRWPRVRKEEEEEESFDDMKEGKAWVSNVQSEADRNSNMSSYSCLCRNGVMSKSNSSTCFG